MFQTSAGVDLPALKTFAQQHGIESSVFYGEQAFFVPVHERLAPTDRAKLLGENVANVYGL